MSWNLLHQFVPGNPLPDTYFHYKVLPGSGLVSASAGISRICSNQRDRVLTVVNLASIKRKSGSEYLRPSRRCFASEVFCFCYMC